MFSPSKFTLKIALIPLTLCALAGCWEEYATVRPEDRIRRLSDTDRERLEETLESLGRAESALRIVTATEPETNPPAKTTALANTLLPAVCALSSQTTDHKWGPVDLSLRAEGAGCPLSAVIETQSTRQGVQTNLSLSFSRRIPEDQRLNDAREVVAFSASGVRVRRSIPNVALPALQQDDEIQGQGRLLNGDTVHVRVAALTRTVHGKRTHEYRRRTLTLTLTAPPPPTPTPGPEPTPTPAPRTRTFSLESEENGDGETYHRLNGEDIPAAVFEDYFSRLGFIGSLSPSTDAG